MVQKRFDASIAGLMGILLCAPISVSGADGLSVAGVIRDNVALNEAHDVELQGDHAIVAGKGDTVAIINIANPTSPRLIWHRTDADVIPDSETILLDKGRVFLGSKHFHSIDISDATAPKFDATLGRPGEIDTINGMARRGDIIFAANKRGIMNAFDVSNPSEPKLVGLIKTDERYGILFPHDIDLYCEYAVIVDPNSFGMNPGNLALFRVFDEDGVLLPDSEWRLVGRISSDSLNGANRVQIQGKYAYVGGSYFPKVSKGRALAKGVVVDLSDPASPTEVASVSFPDSRGPNGLTVSGNVWFLGGGQTVQAYDIRDPRQPRLLVSQKSKEAFPTADDNAHDLVYRGGYLYVTSQGDHGLVVFKVNDSELRMLAESEPSTISR